MKDMHRLPPAAPETVSRRIFTFLHNQGQLYTDAKHEVPEEPKEVKKTSTTPFHGHEGDMDKSGKEEKAGAVVGEEKMAIRRRPLDVLNVGREAGTSVY